MKIAHLTSRHPRDDIRVFHKMACSTAKSHDSYLVVCDQLGNDFVDFVNIVDVGSDEKKTLLRIVKNIRLVYLKAIELDADIYQIHDPELLIIAPKLKKGGKVVIFDMHEHTATQIKIRPYLKSSILKSIVSRSYSFIENYVLRKIDYIFVPQICMEKEFSNINSHTVIIANFPDRKVDVEPPTHVNPKKLIYSGSISEERGAINMLDALAALPYDYSLTLCGSIPKLLLDRMQQHDAWFKVDYRGRVDQNALAKIYQQHSIGLILFNNVGQYYMSYSLKLFEYMMHGMTVIMPNFGDWVKFNDKHKVGYNVDVQDSKAIANKIKSLEPKSMLELGYRNKEKVQQEFNWLAEEKKLLDLYRQIREINESC